MQFSITPELQQFVNAQIQGGAYPSADALLSDAIRLLAEHNLQKKKRIEAMDQFIQVGLDEAAHGDYCDAEEVWKKLDNIIADAEQKNA